MEIEVPSFKLPVHAFNFPIRRISNASNPQTDALRPTDRSGESQYAVLLPTAWLIRIRVPRKRIFREASAALSRLHRLPDLSMAIASISTAASSGSFEISTVERAGRNSPKKSA